MPEALLETRGKMHRIETDGKRERESERWREKQLETFEWKQNSLLIY